MPTFTYKGTTADGTAVEETFEATDRSGEKVLVDKEYVNQHLGKLIGNDDLTRFIL